jgi:sulfonate transport system ATP-binding protein
LADRVVVLVDGELSLDININIERPRNRGDGDFVALRNRLLRELGVEESAPITPHVSSLVRPGSRIHDGGTR